MGMVPQGRWGAKAQDASILYTAQAIEFNTLVNMLFPIAVVKKRSPSTDLG
jgi:hypothetical protein